MNKQNLCMYSRNKTPKCFQATLVLKFILTGAGGAALLWVVFGVFAVDDTLNFCFSDDTFLSQPSGKYFLQFVHLYK